MLRPRSASSLFRMAINQLHGNAFEDLLRPGFPGSAANPQAHDAVFDFAAGDDPLSGLPTSVKTTGNQTVCLADARRGFDCIEPFRLLVGVYNQSGDTKEVRAIHEFHVTAKEWNDIKGDLTREEVSAFHDGIKSFGLGDHVAGQVWAKAKKRELKSSHPSTAIQLNPKIDSKRQRRLQASISLKALIQGIADHNCYTSGYRGVDLPMVLASSPRERKRRQKTDAGLSPLDETAPND